MELYTRPARRRSLAKPAETRPRRRNATAEGSGRGDAEEVLTMPFTLIFPLSRYATARGKQCVCAKEPMICWWRRRNWGGGGRTAGQRVRVCARIRRAGAAREAQGAETHLRVNWRWWTLYSLRGTEKAGATT